jgi:uncharacterized protein YcbX
MSCTVAHIYRYPVKGLSAEALDTARLREGAGIPCDRAFGLALSTSPLESGEPRWQPKSHFATLVRHERLAALDAHFDARTGVLTVRRGGKPVARGAVGTPVGRAMLEEFFRAYLKGELPGPPRLVGSPEGPMLSDQAQPALSLIGLASVADIERVIGRPVDPLRFRANVYLKGMPAWAEFGWIGREITLGGARLRVVSRIPRCVATNVEPGSGIRDMAIPPRLQAGFGHTDCGVTATVVAGGTISVGDTCDVVDD